MLPKLNCYHNWNITKSKNVTKIKSNSKSKSRRSALITLVLFLYYAYLHISSSFFLYFYYSFIVWSDIFVQIVDVVLVAILLILSWNQSLLHPSSLGLVVAPVGAPRRGEQRGSGSRLYLDVVSTWSREPTGGLDSEQSLGLNISILKIFFLPLFSLWE